MDELIMILPPQSELAIFRLANVSRHLFAQDMVLLLVHMDK
jgi:hypothetical protein